MKLKNICLSLIFLGIFAFACAAKQNAAKTRIVTDMAGRKVTLPATIHSVYTDRFVSLVVFALDQKILCNATFSVTDQAKKYISPDYYRNKPITGSSEEEIIKLHPDVIIYGNLGGSKTIDDANQTQQRLKIPVLVIDFRISKYEQVYTFLGNALGREANAKPILAFLEKNVAPITTGVKSIAPKASVYYAEGVDGMETEPSGSFHSQIIDLLEARNVARTSMGDVHGMSKVSMEQVLVWNPEIVLVWSGLPGGMAGINDEGKSDQSTFAHIMHDPLWAKIKAVQNKKVYQIPSLPFGWFDRPPSSNCLPGVFWAAKILYPNTFGFNLNSVVKEYFGLFYHVSIADKDVEYIMSK
jgi:iron complex transport system substrate-binding protein